MQLGVLLGGSALGGIAGPLGMMVLGTAVNMLTADKRRAKGAKENDLKVSSSAYGKGIAIALGTCRMTGNMFWATSIVERRKYIGQKGKEKSEKKFEKGKAQEVLEYYGNFCMGFCEGEIAEVLRIWADSNLIYDKLNPSEAVDPGFSQEEEGAGGKMGIDANKKGSSPAGGRWPYRFYGGTEGQLPDPMLKRYHGDLAPAHRGLCYIAFDNFPLMDFGNRIPTITVEVVPRRNPSVGFKSLETFEDQGISHPVPAANYLGAQPFFDYYRGRMFDDSDGIVSVYDLESGKEIARWVHPTGIRWILGCDHFGRVLAGQSQTLTGVIRAYDPLTGIEVDLIGLGSFAFFSSGRYIDGEVISFPTTSMCAPIVGQAATAITSLFGDVAVFTTDNPMFPAISTTTWSAARTGLWHFLFGGGSAGISSGAPGLKEFFVNTTTGEVYRFTVGDSLPDLGDTAGTIQTWPRLPDPDGALFHFSFSSGFGRAYAETPFWCASAECYVILEMARTLVGLAKRMYLVRYAADGTQLSRTFIGIFGGNFGPGGNPARRIGQGLIVGYEYVFIYEGTIVRFDCRDGTFKMQALNKNNPDLGEGQHYLDRISSILMRVRDPVTDKFEWALVRTDLYEQVPVTLAEVIKEIVSRAGVALDRIDTTGIRNVEVPGYYLDNPGSAADALALLMEAYLFDLCESDDRLKFISRGNRPTLRVPQRLLGNSNRSEDGPLVETVMPETQLPQTVVITYVDKDNDYQSGSQRYRRPRSPYSSMQSTDQVDISVPICLSPDDAKQMAETICFAIWTEKATVKFSLPTQFLIYDPTDVFDIQLDDGKTFEVRLSQADVGANWEIDCIGVRQVSPRYTRPENLSSEFFPVAAYDPSSGWLLQPENGSIQDPSNMDWLDASSGEVVEPWSDPRLAYPAYAVEDLRNVYTGTSIGATAKGPVYIPRSTVPAVDPVLLDIPLNEDADAADDAGFTSYWGVLANRRMSSAAALGVKVSPGDYDVLGSVQGDLIYGSVLGILPDPPNGPHATDDKTVLRVMPAYDYEAADYYQWESIPDAEWPSYVNMALVGDEIILFKNAERDPDTGVVTLSHLIRAHRGTEWAAYGHKGSELFILMNTSAEQVITMPSNALNQPVVYKAASGALLQGFKLPITQVYQAKAQKPYAVNHIVATPLEGLADTTFVWQRRTRYNGPLRDGLGTVALNEEAEAYRIFVLKEPITTETASWFEPTTMTTPQALAGELILAVLTGTPPESNPVTGEEYLAVRMIETNTATWTYTTADRVADGIGSNPYAIVIYQMSARAGYGFPAFLNMQTGV